MRDRWKGRKDRCSGLEGLKSIVLGSKIKARHFNTITKGEDKKEKRT